MHSPQVSQMSVRPSSATSPLALYVAKLERRAPLPAEARDALLTLPFRLRTLEAYRDIIREGDRPTHCCLVVTGLVSRYKTLRNGSRQILSFHLPGDMVDLQSALVVIADHGVRAHVPSEVALVEHAAILELAAKLPELGRALWFDTLIDGAVFREWMVNVGRRTALQRTAHLLLELHYRMGEIGAADGDSFPLPLSQADLSDALGISPVHLNRTRTADPLDLAHGDYRGSSAADRNCGIPAPLPSPGRPTRRGLNATRRFRSAGIA